MGAELNVSLDVSSNRLKVGDVIEIRVRIRNESQSPVTAPPGVRPYAINTIAMRGADGKRLKAFPKTIVDFAPETSDDVAALANGDSRTLILRATLFEGTVRDVREGRAVEGLFLDFGDSVIQVPEPGNYSLEARAKRTYELARELEAAFRIKNAWYGTLASEPVAVTILRAARPMPNQ